MTDLSCVACGTDRRQDTERNVQKYRWILSIAPTPNITANVIIDEKGKNIGERVLNLSCVDCGKESSSTLYGCTQIGIR